MPLLRLFLLAFTISIAFAPFAQARTITGTVEVINPSDETLQLKIRPPEDEELDAGTVHLTMLPDTEFKGMHSFSEFKVGDEISIEAREDVKDRMLAEKVAVLSDPKGVVQVTVRPLEESKSPGFFEFLVLRMQKFFYSAQNNEKTDKQLFRKQAEAELKFLREKLSYLSKAQKQGLSKDGVPEKSRAVLDQPVKFLREAQTHLAYLYKFDLNELEQDLNAKPMGNMSRLWKFAAENYVQAAEKTALGINKASARILPEKEAFGFEYELRLYQLENKVAQLRKNLEERPEAAKSSIDLLEQKLRSARESKEILTRINQQDEWLQARQKLEYQIQEIETEYFKSLDLLN